MSEEKPQPEGKKAQPRKRAPWIVRFFGSIVALSVLTAIVLGVSATISYHVVVHYIRRHEVEVPNLTRMTTSEALETLQSLNLSLAMDDSEYHDLIPEGAILRQRPRHGSMAKSGTPIHVVLSRGPEHTAVPEVLGFSLVDAGVALRASDLNVGVVTHFADSSVPVDTVITQSPLPGEALRRGQPVNLLVSTGSPVEIFTAPSLMGMTIPEIQQALIPYGCTVGEVRQANAPPGAEHGTVIGQSPAPGEALESGSVVDLVVARRL